MSATLLYAGIGSRATPTQVLIQMGQIAAKLSKRGYVLRSGAADGADTAFEAGCTRSGGKTEIWLPWKGFNQHRDTGRYPTPAHEQLAETLHPAWSSLSRGPRALHARNVGQILGADLATPVSFVVCWTPDGCTDEASRSPGTGGTGTAIALAYRTGIPVFNLANPDAYDRLVTHVLADCRPFHPDGKRPASGEILVFGSNLAGRHGKGSALEAATRFGAIAGQGTGRQGDNYAIPTKDGRPGKPPLASPASSLPLPAIRQSVNEFIAYANAHPQERFFVVRVGCGLAGHPDADIAPLFAKAPSHCSFPDNWMPWLGTRATVPTRKPTRVVHVNDAPYTVYVGRANPSVGLPESPWHNPFKIGVNGSREQVVAQYFEYVKAQPELMSRLPELRGQVLGCWCKTGAAPDTLCHGDVLAALADSGSWAPPRAAQGELF